MVEKDVSSPSKRDADIYNIWLDVTKKTFSDHPESKMDGHQKCFATMQQVWTARKTRWQLSKYRNGYWNWCGSQAYFHWRIFQFYSQRIELVPIRTWCICAATTGVSTGGGCVTERTTAGTGRTKSRSTAVVSSATFSLVGITCRKQSLKKF